jgi:Uma2 family endonuclease
MTQATTPLTLEEYLAVDGEEWIRLGLPEGRCEYQDGALQELPPESDLNDRIALNLRDYLIEQVSNEWLIRIHSCEIAVPKIRSQDPATRFPDLVILEEKHLPIIERRLAIPLNTVPPKLIAEVVSPGEKNEARDDQDKRAQYAARGIPEYWLLEPHYDRIRVQELRNGEYVEKGVFRGIDRLVSKTFPHLRLTAGQMLTFVTSRLKQEIERADRAEQAEQRAEQQAEAERQRAERAEEQVESERMRAEQAEAQLAAERQQAEQQAEAERQRAERLAAQLRAMGINPDEI